MDIEVSWENGSVTLTIHVVVRCFILSPPCKASDYVFKGAFAMCSFADGTSFNTKSCCQDSPKGYFIPFCGMPLLCRSIPETITLFKGEAERSLWEFYFFFKMFLTILSSFVNQTETPIQTVNIDIEFDKCNFVVSSSLNASVSWVLEETNACEVLSMGVYLRAVWRRRTINKSPWSRSYVT